MRVLAASTPVKSSMWTFGKASRKTSFQKRALSECVSVKVRECELLCVGLGVKFNSSSLPTLPSVISWSFNSIEDFTTRIISCLHVILLLENVKVMGGIRASLVSGVWVLLLFVTLFGAALKFPVVKASGTIYIRSDGSVFPSTPSITTEDNITYTFVGNISDSIVV